MDSFGPLICVQLLNFFSTDFLLRAFFFLRFGRYLSLNVVVYYTLNMFPLFSERRSEYHCVHPQKHNTDLNKDQKWGGSIHVMHRLSIDKKATWKCYFKTSI